MREISKEQVKEKIKILNPHWVQGEVDTDLRKEKRRGYFNIFYPLVISPVQRAVILMGPRRVGKTVLLWQTIQNLIDSKRNPKNLFYISLDTPILHPYSLESLLDLYKEIFSIKNLKGKVIIFDEIQYVKDWDRQLKVLVDTYPKTKFVASGSAASALKRKSVESGAGRFTDFNLPPLTFHEYLDLLDLAESLIEIKVNKKGEIIEVIPGNIEKLNPQFINYINYGGFPEAIFNEEIRKDPQRFIRSDIIDKVLLRDLPSLYGIQDTQELNRLFSFLAFQTGNEVSLEGLSRASGIAKNTIKKYIEYLEAAFLIRTVNRIDDSGKRFKRRNYFKVYLANPSMYSAIYGPVSEADPATLGNLVETAIFSQWMHQPEVMRNIYYARWKGGEGEVDMVIVDKNMKISWCMEVKWSDRYLDSPEDLKGLIYFCRKNNINRPIVTTKSKIQLVKRKNITFRFIESAAYCFIIGHAIISKKNSEAFLQFAKDHDLA